MPEPEQLLKFFKQKVSRVSEALQTIPKKGRDLTTSEKRAHRPISPIKFEESSVDADDEDNAIKRHPPNLISPENRRSLLVKAYPDEDSDEEAARRRMEEDEDWQEYKRINQNLMFGCGFDPDIEEDADGFKDLCFSARTEFTQPKEAENNIDQDDNK